MPRPRKIWVAPRHENAAKRLQEMPPDVLQEILLSSGNERFINLAHALKSPQFKQRSIIQLCSMCAIGLPDVTELFKKNMLAMATLKQMEHAPAILETNAQAATGRQELCPTCGGRKRLIETCPDCAGKKRAKGRPCRTCTETGSVDRGPCLTCGEQGWVMGAGDPNAYKGFMESAGLIKHPGINVGVGVNLNQNFGGSAFFEDLMRGADKKVIEGSKTE